ncbi:hypothetical protein BDK89_0769 [Ilumatobacter fluminis]|uniref:DUF4244 domain-containing protein n=1 Tax=Ilumatobacter fluminis TaxID=467091 RepID=A0A4R7HWA6_9ACTN|nr:hypothetical protein [Ilumatobacter fluminis]TDT15205.1 hypothetical protein BDK89_0769 [Ilumatobacter fluminis]
MYPTRTTSRTTLRPGSRQARRNTDHGRDAVGRPPVRDRGQATTEYALILLAAALVAVLVIGWATAGGGAAAIGRLFDSAINAAIDQLG